MQAEKCAIWPRTVPLQIDRSASVGRMIPGDFFPNMPSQVLEMWLQPMAEERGWPFRSLDDDISQTDWHYTFARKPLRYWAGLQWEMGEVNVALDFLDEYGLQFIKGLIPSGQPTDYNDPFATRTHVRGAEGRFWAAARFIQEHGKIPLPIVVLRTPSGLKVMDGSHRVAALIHLGMLPGYKIPAWVAG